MSSTARDHWAPPKRKSTIVRMFEFNELEGEGTYALPHDLAMPPGGWKPFHVEHSVRVTELEDDTIALGVRVVRIWASRVEL